MDQVDDHGDGVQSSGVGREDAQHGQDQRDLDGRLKDEPEERRSAGIGAELCDEQGPGGGMEDGEPDDPEERAAGENHPRLRRDS